MLPHTLLVVLFAVFAALLHTCLVRHQFTALCRRCRELQIAYTVVSTAQREGLYV